MTTIAANHEGMAADTLVVVGDTVFTRQGKKLVRVHGHIIGFAGFAAGAEECIKRMREAKEIHPLAFLTVYEHNSQFTMLVKSPEGVLYRYDGNGSPVVCPEGIAAIGTGGDFALGALAAGASLRKAMRIALDMDTKSGGRISVFKG